MREAFYHIRNSYVRCAILLCLCLGLSSTVQAADSPCDPNLPQQFSDNLGYRVREDRCEGRYVQEVGNPEISLLSLTNGFTEYDLESGKALQLEWHTPQAQEVHLRANDLRKNLYYRMDTTRAPASTSDLWPSGLLAALEIPRQDLGVLAWTSYHFGQEKFEVFLPLQIRQAGATIQDTRYRAVLWPGKELTEVYISLATLDANGNPENFIKDGDILGYGYYPAQSPIVFELSGMTAPGFYYLEIGADFTSGASDVQKYRFYYGG